MKSKLENTFDNYLKNYDMNEKRIKYKYYHSYRVKDLMKEISTRIGLSKKEIEVAEVIGLLHDIGRFEQIKKYNLCSDVKSGIDHADESCIYLFDEGNIKDFYDDENYYEIIKDAIKNHNKYKIDSKLCGKNLLFAKLIRDMDKVDIYRVLYEEYQYEFDKNLLTKKVVDTFNKKQTIRSEDIKSKSDVILSYFAFLYDINFRETFIIIKEGKYLDNLFKILIPKEDSIEEFEIIKKNILDYINKKIETM